MSVITIRYQGEDRGGPPYHPRMMVKALFYGYCTGAASSRRIARRLHEDIAFRVLAATTLQTSARTTWRRWPACSCRRWSSAGGRDW